tara:strand:+ start:236 stop:472 length:237 start_codon:yes stop_codon:yes gene_type:complete
MSDEEKFDFESISQESEELSFDKLLPCPHCNKPIPQESTMCLYCSEEVNFYGSKRPIWVIVTAVIVLIAFTALMLMSF